MATTHEESKTVSISDDKVKAMFNGLSTVMGSMTAADFPMVPAKDLITFKTTDDTQLVFSTLTQKHITSAPVYDDATGDYVGFIDMSDLTAHLVHAHTSAGVSGSELTTAFKDLRNLLAATSLTLPSATLDSVNVSRNNPWMPVEATQPLATVFQLLCSTPSSGGSVHRVPVIDPTSKALIGVITQSRVIQFLREHIVRLGPVLSIEVPRRAVITVNADAPVMKAFELMLEHKVTGLPVVDAPDGKVVAVITTADVRRAVYHNRTTGLIGASVLDFVQAVRLEEERRRGDGATRALVFAVGKTASYADALQKIAALRVHRVYVESEEGKCVGVVSCKDIISRLVNARQPDVTH